MGKDIDIKVVCPSCKHENLYTIWGSDTSILVNFICNKCNHDFHKSTTTIVKVK